MDLSHGFYIMDLETAYKKLNVALIKPPEMFWVLPEI